MNVIGKGTIEIQAKVDKKTCSIEMKNVWYVPSIPRSLFSVLAAQDECKNSEFRSTATTCKFFVGKELKLVGHREVGGSLYKADIKAVVVNEVYAAQAQDTLQLYHERWGHQDKRYVQQKLRS